MFHPSSYGFRPGRACKDALREVDRLGEGGYRYAVDADLKGYFDSIPHGRLMERVREQSAMAGCSTLEGWLKQDIMDGMGSWTPVGGTPQGAVISPLLANIYLHPLDELMAAMATKWCGTRTTSWSSAKAGKKPKPPLRSFATGRADNGLALHPDKTHIGDCGKKGGASASSATASRPHAATSARRACGLKDKIRAKTSGPGGIVWNGSSPSSNPGSRDGSATSGTPSPLKRWTDWSRRVRAILRKQEKRPGFDDARRYRSVGPTLSSQRPGCSPFTRPGSKRDAPDEETTDWRAVCGKTARTVRREGRPQTVPTPISRDAGRVGSRVLRPRLAGSVADARALAIRPAPLLASRSLLRDRWIASLRSQ